MRVTAKLSLSLFILAPSLSAQTTPTEWVEALGDPAVTGLVARIEEEEASMPPLSPLSQAWLESVSELGSRLLLSGVHRSDARYEDVIPYLYERGRWAGIPVERIERYREMSETLFAAVAGGPDELVVTAELLGREAEDLEAGEASESGVLDALRRLELELLTAKEIAEKGAAAARLAAATTLVVEMEDSLSLGDAPYWKGVSELFRRTRGAVEELQGADEAPALSLSPEERELGVPEEATVRVLFRADPALAEMALRWDSQIALGAATSFDRYRWSLAPVGARARLGATIFVIEERERELYLELFRRRMADRREAAQLSREESASEQLREQLLREAENVLARFEERSRRGDEESERWALLSVLSHPYAQRLLFRSGQEQLRSAIAQKVETLYREVDDRARELLGLVARRHAVADWEYEVTRVPDSFDRIVTVRFLPRENAEVGQELRTQFADAYYRAFNLVTNPEQNLDAPGQGVARWSMLHGQYLESREVAMLGDRGGSSPAPFRTELEPWFLEAEREDEPRAAFPFVFRGFQRIRFEQERWLSEAQGRLPRRMAPIPPADLLLAAEAVEAFLAGKHSLYTTERLLAYLFETDILPAQFAWAEALGEAQRRYERVSRSETTSALLTLLSRSQGLPESYAILRGVMEARLRRVLLLQELGLEDPSIGEEAIYQAWIESAVEALLRNGPIREVLTLPERWQEEGLLPPVAAQRFYRALSREATRILTTGEAANE